MTWVKIDDGATEHPKVLSVGAAAAWLWVCGLAYCNRQKRRDGVIPLSKVKLLYPGVGLKQAEALVSAGLWEKLPDAFRIHDYQPNTDRDVPPWRMLMEAQKWSTDAYGAVRARDGNRCRYCGSADHLSVDHIVPRCQGGGDEGPNLVIACRSCNSRKGGRTPEQAGMRLRPLPQETATGASVGPMSSSESNDGSVH